MMRVRLSIREGKRLFTEFGLELLDEAERASRKAMAVIAPETDETSEVKFDLFARKIFATFAIDRLWCA